MPVKVEQAVKEDVKEQKVDLKNIPSLEKIWNDTPPKAEMISQKEVKELSSPLDEIRQAIPAPKQVQTSSKPVQNQNISQINKTTPKNQPVINNQSKSTSKPVTQPKPVTTQSKPSTSQSKPAATQPKPVTQNKKTSNPNNLKPASAAQNTSTQNVQNKAVENPKRVYDPNNPEMLKYKGSLRAALFAKLPVGSIQGSGSCSVQFSVDKSGKLINRTFTKQSENKSLNDAVYYMLMSVPHFASPPEGYNQEVIRMNITMNPDGSYEISIH